MTSPKWLNGRLSDIQARLGEQCVSRPVISRLLKGHDYSLKANDQQVSGAQPPERDRQFTTIREQREPHQEAGQPIISVDTKTKELIGNVKTPGQTGCQSAEGVKVHDFQHDALGRAVPYGI